MMKTVCLPETTWRELCDLVSELPANADRHFAEMILEQLSGAVTVRATRGGMNVKMKAPKGGDLRDVVAALAGK